MKETIINLKNSMFGQLLQVVPRKEFNAAVKKYGADWRSKGFSTWDQFVGMMFCQFEKAKSLSDISNGVRPAYFMN